MSSDVVEALNKVSFSLLGHTLLLMMIPKRRLGTPRIESGRASTLLDHVMSYAMIHGHERSVDASNQSSSIIYGPSGHQSLSSAAVSTSAGHGRRKDIHLPPVAVGIGIGLGLGLT